MTKPGNAELALTELEICNVPDIMAKPCQVAEDALAHEIQPGVARPETDPPARFSCPFVRHLSLLVSCESPTLNYPPG